MRSIEGAQAEFVRSVGPRLIGSLSLYCGDRHLAEDLSQEALARTIERWDRVCAMAAPEAWTYRTAFNLARSSFRHRAVERRNRGRLAVVDPLPDATDAIAVRAAVRLLPERQRAVIVARFYLDLDVAETARMLRCREGTVKAHTFKAVANLRAAGLVEKEETVDDAPR
jgi:RNA polymerase sigma factor (sigma-70 family)